MVALKAISEPLESESFKVIKPSTLESVSAVSSVFLTASAKVSVIFEAAATPTLVFDPDDLETGVAAASNITLTFAEAVRNTDDTALTDSNVDGLITLKDSDSSGSDIAFNATIDSD
jgi:hypothetical protein